VDKFESDRREKLQRIEAIGHDPWGRRFDGNRPIAELRAQCEAAEYSGPEGPAVRVAGRIMGSRDMGKARFLDVQDRTGRMQVFIGRKQIGDEAWALSDCFDLGDLIGADGKLGRTRTGEITVFAEQIHFLTKSLLPPPEKFHGLADVELRQRSRHLDLIHTPGVLETFLDRTRIVQAVRGCLAEQGYVEVETPTLHLTAGGAAARPFITHHNALDLDLFLRIALELHLKRLLVGGVERVFELGRVFRNEGIDARHNPEFTMLEVYQAYGNYETMMDLTEALVAAALEASGGAMQRPWGEGDIDFTPPWPRRKYADVFAEYVGADMHDTAAVTDAAQRHGIETGGKHPDVVVHQLFEEVVEDRLLNPTFVIDYPASLCPLTKRKRDAPAIAERFELYIQGMEIANAYTELNDPDLQEELFRTQLQGLPEEDSMARMDEDFVRALKHGMPPAGGLGVGIDRLVMLLTNRQNLRDVILFPLLRPESK
jgi:lysyl-tRNA synthetase class 2